MFGRAEVGGGGAQNNSTTGDIISLPRIGGGGRGKNVRIRDFPYFLDLRRPPPPPRIPVINGRP